MQNVLAQKKTTSPFVRSSCASAAELLGSDSVVLSFATFDFTEDEGFAELLTIPVSSGLLINCDWMAGAADWVGTALSVGSVRGAGAAEGEPARRVYHDTGLFGGVTASSYRMG